MARKTTEATVRPRPIRRWIVAGILGVLLGVLCVLFISNIYNPFAASIDDPLALIPGDADFVLRLPDFPTFLREIRPRPAIEALSQHPGFQRFLDRPVVRKRGVMEAIGDAFRQLDGLEGRLPFGLSLLGDVSGRTVVLAGWEGGDDETWPFLCVIRPESWLALAGVNMLLDERLSSWFLDENLAREGLKLRHYREVVEIVGPSGPPLYVTRIGDAVLISTRENELSRIQKAVQLEGIPDEPARRFAPLESGLGSVWSEATLLMDREAVDRTLKLTQTLEDLWGPATLELATSLVPRIGGQDLVLRLQVQQGIQLDLQALAAPGRPGDLAPFLLPMDRSGLDRRLDTLGSMLPAGVFAMLALEAPFGEVLGILLERPLVVGAEERRSFEDWARSIPEFGSLAGFQSALDETLGRQAAILWFQQPRPALEDEAEAGYVLAWPIADRARLDAILQTLETQVRRTAGEGILKDLVRTEQEGIVLYEPVPVAGLIDDPRVTRPGFAIVQGYFLATNFLPWLRQVPDVLADRVPALGRPGPLAEAAGYAPDQSDLAGVLDFGALVPYVQQSASGWAWQQTYPSQSEMMKWRTRFAQEAAERGIPSGSREWDEYIQSRFSQAHDARVRVDRPQIRRDIEGYLDDFKEAFSSLGFFVDHRSGGMGLRLRFDPRH